MPGNPALREQAAKRVVGYVEAAGAVFDSYWVPLAGSEDIYLHFFTDITEYAAERLLPARCGGERVRGAAPAVAGNSTVH